MYSLEYFILIEGVLLLLFVILVDFNERPM